MQMVQRDGSFERASLPLIGEDPAFDVHVATAPPEGGFESQETAQRTLGKVSVDGFSAEAGLNIEDRRKNECLGLIEENYPRKSLATYGQYFS
jgi:hypothetical protein